MERKSWEEFRATGLVLFINQVLHVFGWAVVFDIDDESGNVNDVYMARVKFRGFDHQSVSEEYTKITEYIHKEADDLLHDVYSTEI